MKSGAGLPTGILISAGGIGARQAASQVLNANTSQIDLFTYILFIAFISLGRS
jgi:hypothetical protein